MKKLISIMLVLLAINLHAYDLINNTYIINNTAEEINVYYQRCSTNGVNTVCQVSNKLTIPAENDGDNVGKIEIKGDPFNNIHITKINSKTRSSNYASVSELLDYIKHGYKATDIMTCQVFQQSYFEHILIENVDNQITCRSKEMFVS